LHKVANRQTNKQRRLHILLGGGNKYCEIVVQRAGLLPTGNCWRVVDPEVAISLICDARYYQPISRTCRQARIDALY